MRSQARVEEDLPSDADEMNYAAKLNHVLPPEIRITGWATVPDTFDAR